MGYKWWEIRRASTVTSSVRPKKMFVPMSMPSKIVGIHNQSVKTYHSQTYVCECVCVSISVRVRRTSSRNSNCIYTLPCQGASASQINNDTRKNQLCLMVVSVMLNARRSSFAELYVSEKMHIVFVHRFQLYYNLQLPPCWAAHAQTRSAPL